MPHLHHSVLEVQLRTGSRFETEADNGLSHFLEHMLYRGTPSHPSAQAQSLAFERLGGTLMAATAKDYGSLQIDLPQSTFLEALPLVAEVYCSPLLTDGLEVERGIVREEILETLDETGRVTDPDEVLAALAFRDHPLGYPITGRIEQLEGFDAPRLRQHHARTHVARGTTITAAGPVDVERTLRTLERVFSGVPSGPALEHTAAKPQREPRFRCVSQTGSQTSLRVAFQGPSYRSPLEPETQVLLRLLDDGMSTRLYEQLCDRQGLCYDVGACFEAYEDVGLVHLSADCANANAAQVLGELLRVVQDLRNHGPSATELEKAKARHSWHLDLMLDDPEAVATHFGWNALVGIFERLEERRARIAEVTTEGVAQAAQEAFRRERLNIAAVGAQSRRQAENLRELGRRFE